MATSNTLTGIIPTLYTALNRVSRENVGLVTAVTRDATADRAALNQVVRVPIGEAGALETITPGANPAASGGTTVNYADVTITNAKAAPILWSGEERLSVSQFGSYDVILADQIADGMRKIVNQMEIDIALAGKLGASRAYGTAGTAPFATAASLTDTAGLLKILEDNGAGDLDLQLALNSSAIANLRGVQSGLFKVNEAGSEDMLRNGFTDRLQGFALRKTAGFRTHTKGTGTSYQTNLVAGYAVGDTSIALDTGSGTVLAGDVVTYAGDTNKYVVNTGVAAAGSIVMAKPGLQATLADNVAMTIGNNYTPNLGFARSAIALACRAPALPGGRDMAQDRMMITDPVSGLSFEVSMYYQYRQVKIEVALAWGVAVIKPEHVAILLG
jgi:hypothetical protein